MRQETGSAASFDRHISLGTMKNQCPICSQRFSLLRGPRLKSWVRGPASAVICRSCGADLIVQPNTGSVFVILLAAMAIAGVRFVLAYFLDEPHVYIALFGISLIILIAAVVYAARRQEYIAQPGAPGDAPPKGVAPLS